MTPETYARIRALFDRAMALSLGERQPFLDAHVPPGDPLRAQLLAMVEAGDDSAFLVNAVVAGMPETVCDPDMPQQIGSYRLLRVLGRGGMGVVYLALRNDDVFRKVVALKVIDGELGSGDAGHVDRFKRERQILAGLDHPNIARILDGGSTEDGRPYYVMEYVAGSPIDEYCERMNTDVPSRVRMMAQACDAIEYLHANAIAHRDIKPHNILVTLDGRIKLVDFGIAKLETATASVGASGAPTMIMTPGYASPEQVAGDASGKSGDIYSIAVVLYQLLTRKLPYADPQGRPNLDAQLSGKPPEPPSRELTRAFKTGSAHTELRTLSVHDLDRVVLRALQRDPLRRYPTVQLFAEDLRRCLDGRPITTRQGSLGYSFGKFLVRNRAATAVVALAFVALSIGSWMAVGAWIEQAKLEAREAEFERFVAMFGSKVAGWETAVAPVAPAEKVADVAAASRMMGSDSVRSLASRAPDPARVKRTVGNLRQILDRADAASSAEPPVRKEISRVFRAIGDFENTARLPQLADRSDTAASYRRAAVIAQDIRSADPEWADRELSELSTMLIALGAPLAAPGVADSSATTELFAAEPPRAAENVEHAVSTARSPEPPPSPAAAEQPAASAVVPVRPPVDVALRVDLVQRLRATTSGVERAKLHVESLQATLASRGQAMRADVVGYLSEAQALVEDARGLLDADDLQAAEDHLRRAEAQLRRIFQAVGG